MPEIQINKNLIIPKILIGLIIVLSVGIGLSFLFLRAPAKMIDSVAEVIIQPVSAKEIYPVFFCPCCGEPLDAENVCCPMAQERISFIDELVAGNAQEKDIIISYAKKYGLNSFIDENRAREFREELIAVAPDSRPIISVNPESIDLGDVSQAKGEASALFEIVNNGKTDLIIDKIETSCGCTVASIIYQNQEGPRFGMPGHGINENIDENWSVSIAAGQTANLKVYYDPNMHEDLRGAVIREIHIFSNDPIDFDKKAQIELNQVD